MNYQIWAWIAGEPDMDRVNIIFVFDEPYLNQNEKSLGSDRTRIKRGSSLYLVTCCIRPVELKFGVVFLDLALTQKYFQ